MKKYQKTIAYYMVIFLFCMISAIGLFRQAEAYYGQIPTWTSNLSYGWGGPPAYMNYNSYQRYSDPYTYGPPVGYYPYNAMFNVYSGGYNVNMGYNQNVMGYYNAANYTGYGQRDVNAIGYPYPYAYTNQNAWYNQTNYASGTPYTPPVTTSYTNAGNPPPNVYYDPAAFTVDLGLNAYVTGINNFWKKIFTQLQEEDKDSNN